MVRPLRDVPPKAARNLGMKLLALGRATTVAKINALAGGLLVALIVLTSTFGGRGRS